MSSKILDSSLKNVSTFKIFGQMEKLVSRRPDGTGVSSSGFKFPSHAAMYREKERERERKRERAIDPMLEALAAHRLILLSNLHSNPVLHAIYVSLHFAWTDIPANFFSSTRGSLLRNTPTRRVK